MYRIFQYVLIFCLQNPHLHRKIKSLDIEGWVVGAVRRATIKVSGVMALSVQLTMTHNTMSPLTALPTEPSAYHTPILKRKCVAVKVVSRKPSHMEPSCCHVATSERRHIQSKADTHFFALREASIRRSQRGNNSSSSETQLFPTFSHTQFRNIFSMN